MKTQKGITLIALIITIIVMLILVGVTINVAMQGGLFEKAKNAATATQKEADKEELLSAVFGTYDAITAENVKKGLGDEWKVIDNGNGTLTCSKGANIFIVNKSTGAIEEGEGSITIGTTSLSMKSKNETGEISEITLIGVDGNITWTSSDESVATVSGNNERATVTAQGNGTAIITATVNGKKATCNVTVNLGWIDNGDGTYTKGTETVEVGKTTYTNSQVQEKLGASGGTYTGTWTVIGFDGDKIKLVSSTNLDGDNVKLGFEDPRAKTANPAVDESSLTNAEKLQRAIWSYNHVVETLDLAVQERTGIESARSITIEDIYEILGEENIDKGTEYGKIYKYYWENRKIYHKIFDEGTTDEEIENTWSSISGTRGNYATFTAPDGTVIDANNTEATSKQVNTLYAYTTTKDQKAVLGSLAIGVYWLASPNVECGNYDSTFCVPHLYNGDLENYSIFSSSGTVFGDGSHLRAIITI